MGLRLEVRRGRAKEGRLRSQPPESVAKIVGRAFPDDPMGRIQRVGRRKEERPRNKEEGKPWPRVWVWRVGRLSTRLL